MYAWGKAYAHDFMRNLKLLCIVRCHEVPPIDGIDVFQLHMPFGCYEGKNLLRQPLGAAIFSLAL